MKKIRTDLTREETLKLHRQMWTDMQKELGDYPNDTKRLAFKKKWCEEHGFTHVRSNCFLCEYVQQQNATCGKCPIDWSKAESISGLCDPRKYTCQSEYGDNEMNDYYLVAPISSILAIPERKE